jgi:hypothetical protein
MAEGMVVLHVQCRLCGHASSIPQAELVARFGPFLPADLKPALRCMNCGVRGDVEIRLGWAGASPSQAPGQS